MRTALVLVALTACSVNRTVLEGGIIDCTEALTLGVTGQPCDLATACSSATDCCNKTAYCREGSLVVAEVCNADCTSCADDSECAFGGAICENHRCVPCGDACPVDTCPVTWPHLSRNGCAQCTCAPAATCENIGGQCPNGVCYRGAVCVAGCVSADLRCCANQCEAFGCPSPVPTGCLMTCPPALGSCVTCAAESCTCNAGQWSCTAICADGLTSSCVAPPEMAASPVNTPPPP